MPSLKEISARSGIAGLSIPVPVSRFFSAFGPAILLLLMLILALGRELFSGNVIGSTHLDNDLGYFLALRKLTFYGDSSFPLWNPSLMCGVPLIAEIQSGLFYPPNIVFRFFPLDIAVNLSLFIHLYLAALCTYYFGRQVHISRAGALITASVFCFCGPVFLSLFAGHHANLFTIAWIPAVFILVNRIGITAGLKNYVYLGLIFCMQLLAGHPQYLYYTVLVSWLYLLFVSRHRMNRKLIRSWVLHQVGFFFSVGIAALISLPQILPVHEMLSLSARTNLNISDVAWFSFPPLNLLTFLTPRIFGDGVKLSYWGLYNLWEMCAYCGTMALLLSAVSIKHIKKTSHIVFFLFLAVFALLTALGGHTPLLKLFYHILPGFKMFRGHSKMHIFCCFAIALLAGFGYDALSSISKGRDRRIFIPLLGGLVFLLILILMIPYHGLLENPIKSLLSSIQNDPRAYLPVPGIEHAEFADDAVKQAVSSIRYFMFSLFLGICLLVLTLQFGCRRMLNAMIILFVFFESFIFGKSFVSAVDVHHWDLKPEALEFLTRDQNQFRCAVVTSFGPKYGITALQQQIVGDYPYVLRRYSRLYNLANKGKPTPSMKIAAIRQVSPLFNLFNLKYLIINSNRGLDIPGYYEVYNDGILAIMHNEYARKRVYLPQHIKIADGENDALRGVIEPPTIRGEQIILERDSVARLSFEYGSLLHRKDPNETIDIVEYRPNRIELRAHLASDAWVILTDTFFPGWKATIDDQWEATIVPANFIFRAVYVPQGDHKIVFQYKPSHFFAAIVVASISLAGALAAVVFGDKLLCRFKSAPQQDQWR